MLLTRLDRPRRAIQQRGFTLTELMIALVIMGLVMSVVYKVFSSQDRFFRNQEQIARMQENLRATMEYINQELSWLGYDVNGIAVVKASPADIIFKANIPNSGTTIQYVRYQFNPSTNTIARAAGAATTDIENADLVVMASDMEALAISYYNVLNAVVVTTAADPLCAAEVPSAACAPGTNDDDATLQMVQRIKARVTARTSKPDWLYTDPNGGANPNFRKRAAVLDLRARNVEDVTLIGGQIVPGACGWLTHVITPVSGGYLACPDKTSQYVNLRPELDFSDNPSFMISAFDMDGNANTNPNQVVTVYAVGDDGTPFNIYDSADPFNVDNTIVQGETRYVAAQELSGTAGGNNINLRFAYSDGNCTQTAYDGNQALVIAASPASYFYTGGAFVTGGFTVDYRNNTGLPIVPAAVDKVAMCSSVGNERVLLGVQLNDDCANPIDGETITWSDGGFGGSFTAETDNGDGTYSALYIPPDAMGTVASEYIATLSAQWGTYNPNVDVTFISADAHDIVIDSITDVTQAGIFQYGATVIPRASQLGGNSGNSFTIERVDGQEVKVTFHLEDACGNYVFTPAPFVHSASKGNVSVITNNGDGTYSFIWESTIGCGLEQLGEVITISSSGIANPSTQNETVSFDLLTTRSSDPLAGPFVLMDTIPIGATLWAGNTGDFVTVNASILQYDPTKQYCINLLPGSMSPFSMQFTLAGDVGGNGSFSPLTPFDDHTETVNTDVMGWADVDVFSGTADWDDSITLTAEADIEGAFYSGSIVLSLHETLNPQSDSGFYLDDLFTTKIGSDQTITTFDPGDGIYLRIYDFDENLDPLAQDSFASPYDVFVRVESLLTGDREFVGLTEQLDGNSPNFLIRDPLKRPLDTEFYPSVATSLEQGDGTLQVRDGDTITMYYSDKDNPPDWEDWTIFTPGADSFKVYRIDGTVETDLFSGALQVEEVAYGDKLRPKLSLPFLAGDGRNAVDTVQITVDSGVDSDLMVLREDGDTGIMMPDDTIYSGKHFSVLQSDVADDNDILATPTTPRYINLTYDVFGSYAMTLSFLMRDYDLPEVIITAPSDSDTVSGVVTVMIDANDVGNATSLGGIGRIELYINGRLYHTINTGSDLSGSNSITWTTASGTTAFWLDGSHVLTAKAFDTSNNEATSDPVGVTVDNNLSPIWFNDPSFSSIWSQDMDVEIEVGNLVAEAGTYMVVLNVNSVLETTFTDTGPETFNYTVDTTLLPEGANDLIATITDLESNNYQTTALDFFVDRTLPAIGLPSPFGQPWINKASLPLNVEVNISDSKVAPTDPNDVDDATVTATFSGVCSSGTLAMSEMPAGSDTYTLSWNEPSCDNKEGILTITIEADDIADSPNQASRAASIRLDTLKPTVDTLDVIPMVNQSFTMGSLTLDGFVRGDVTLQADVTDGNLGSSIGAFAAWYYNDPYVGAGPPDGTEFVPIENFQDASSSSFGDTWTTSTYPTGIYVLAAGIVDAAGNSNDTSPTKVLYLDNNQPWINMPSLPWMYSTIEPISGWGVPLLRGQVNVNLNGGDFGGGFLKELEHRYVIAGNDPGTADTPSGSVITSVKYNFTADDKKREFSKSYIMDTCAMIAVANTFDVFAYATDWAGNKSFFAGTTRFIVQDLAFITPPVPAAPVVSFNESPPASGNWLLESQGNFQNCGGDVNGLNVDVNFFRWIWNPGPMTYDPPLVYSTSGVTVGNGNMPPLSAPAGTWSYKSIDLGGVEYKDPFASPPNNIYAVFHPMTLNTPQPYDVYGQYPAWYTEFQPFNQQRILINVTYDLTPSILPAHDLTLDGTVIFNSGHAAVGEPMTMELNWNDPMFGWMWTQFSTVTDSSGNFTFTPPADISITDSVNINIKHPSAYWGDTWMGWIDWDPWIATWRENLQ